MPFATKEQKQAYDRVYREAHREKRAVYKAAYNALPESRRNKLEYDRKWRAAHRESARQSSRRYIRAHPEYAREYVEVRRVRKLGAFVEYVRASVVFKRDQGLCGECGVAVDPNNWHLDHIIPLSKGGEHSYQNTQVTPPACNLQKGSRLDGDR